MSEAKDNPITRLIDMVVEEVSLVDRAACGFWWAIADFQPDPVVDPTLLLEPGRRLFIPSLRVLTDVVLSESQRRAS